MSLLLRIKKPAYKLSHRKRYLRLTSNDQVKSRNLKKFIQMLMLEGSLGEREKAKELLDMAIPAYLSMVALPEDAEELRPPVRTDRVSIDSFSQSECYLNFRFNREQLHELFQNLAFSDRVRFDNRAIMSGEEVFLRGLYELVGGENKQKICLVFGREFSAQVRAFQWFCDYIYDNFHHLVHDNLDWWYRNGLLEESADAIAKKIGVDFPTAPRAALFIDCNCLPTSRCGGGPAGNGADAARWSDMIQRAFYNGWKSIHGLKHQTVDSAHGMTVDMIGPESVRRNDLELLRQSNINDRIALIQLGDDNQFIVFGDSAYKVRSHTRSYFNQDEPNAPELCHRWNLAMKRTRISIEWNYGYTASLFKYIVNHDKLKIMKNEDSVSKVYTVATLFRNFHIACYGGQTSNYFDLVIPPHFLACYINQTDL